MVRKNKHKIKIDRREVNDEEVIKIKGKNKKNTKEDMETEHAKKMQKRSQKWIRLGNPNSTKK